MNSPRIRKDLLLMLHEINESRQEPLARVVDELLRPQVVNAYNQFLARGSYAIQTNLLELKEPRREPPTTILSPADIYEACIDMTSLQQERLDVLVLNIRNHLIVRKIVSLGTLNSSLAHPREIYATAIEYHAAAIVLVHNHPSGNPQPSAEDIRVTKQIAEVGELVQIPLIDHLIIGDGYWVSMKEKDCI